ncbi:hypothetical protein [Alicyclobacillus sp. ALC3]|uniref:hypothetical protein n=1 Tax=Alicyclobacillus sp. ALC3 TaxID=2796143 RepID=UPI002379DE38|nr:hypothetical protein [Alicyclobacillus sp. ALC3]WDL96989.1 hypothetical protein JC200_22385 [Alicyclobacillus sp. ALC3]
MALTESVQDTEQAAESKANGGVTVRVGETSWVVGDFSVSEAVQAVTTGRAVPEVSHEQVKQGVFQPFRRPTLRDSFKTGLVFGLAMGCLGLILFHQMPTMAGAAAATPVGAWPGSAAMTGSTVVMPAVSAYALAVGEYPNDTSARAAQSRLEHSGVASVVFPDSLSRRSLVVQMATQASALSTEANVLRRHNIHPTTVHLASSVRTIPTLSSTSQKDGTRISAWLSAEVSAANTLMASLSDGETARDAQMATEKALQLQPSAAVLGATGYGTALQAVAQNVKNAEQQLLQHHTAQAELDVLSAYSTLASINYQS